MPEAAEALATAGRVLIVPGYGLAVANAQHSIAELTKMLKKKDVQVRVTACCGHQQLKSVSRRGQQPETASGTMSCSGLQRCLCASAAHQLHKLN